MGGQYFGGRDTIHRIGLLQNILSTVYIYVLLVGSLKMNTALEDSVRCFKEIWKVGKVGREGLFMPTWSQL